MAAVRIVSATDVVCARKQDTDFTQQVAIEVDNEYLLKVKREGKNLVDEMNASLTAIQLNRKSEQLQASLERSTGNLWNRLQKAKGGSERKRIKDGKTWVMLKEGDTIDVGVLTQNLQQAEVSMHVA